MKFNKVIDEAYSLCINILRAPVFLGGRVIETKNSVWGSILCNSKILRPVNIPQNDKDSRSESLSNRI